MSATINRQRLLDRFLRYVRIDTTAVDDAGVYPSSPGQMELGAMIAEELAGMGAADVVQDQHGVVMATVPSTTPATENGKQPPVVAFNSHLDTSPETTGKNVQPRVIENYQGGDIQLGQSGLTILESENPELAELHGCTLITTDGTTLLGGDDKAGVAVIVELAQHLLENPQISHGEIRVLLTCDEEIGHGVDHVDIAKVAADVCYTLDGAAAGEIDVETFSADSATITVTGKNIHPSIAKGAMINALRVAASLLTKLPQDQAPETTDGRQPFMHPYTIEGGVAEATLKVLLRSFDTAKLDEFATLIRTAAAATEKEFPGSSIQVDIKQQYRNLGDGLNQEPRAVEYVEQAYKRLGRSYKKTIVRGGTDGSQLTALGLPTPNLSTGQHKIHSPLEWACLDEMQQACELCVEICQVWAGDAKR